jgi:L-rhamnose mutarotase
MSERGISTAAPFVVLGLVLLSGCPTEKVQRHGAVIAIPEENVAEYKHLDAAPRPNPFTMVLKTRFVGLRTVRTLDDTKIHNYSTYLGEVAPDEHYLFAYYEYTSKGKDLDADTAAMKEDKITPQWWRRMDPPHRIPPPGKGHRSWAQWQEVFHHDGPAYKQSQIKSRHGSIIGIPEKSILAYTQMHAAVWPGVQAALDQVNIRNYSIYLGQIKPGEYLLFSYFEYVGDDFQRDMASMADEVTKLWWTYTDPLQTRLPGTPEGQQWKTIEEVFHTN